jgi:hypothetical protein
LALHVVLRHRDRSFYVLDFALQATLALFGAHPRRDLAGQKLCYTAASDLQALRRRHRRTGNQSSSPLHQRLRSELLIICMPEGRGHFAPSLGARSTAFDVNRVEITCTQIRKHRTYHMPRLALGRDEVGVRDPSWKRKENGPISPHYERLQSR